jgi:DNA helicase-2/ATP-dependent DNA helicase PcrA
MLAAFLRATRRTMECRAAVGMLRVTPRVVPRATLRLRPATAGGFLPWRPLAAGALPLRSLVTQSRARGVARAGAWRCVCSGAAPDGSDLPLSTPLAVPADAPHLVALNPEQLRIVTAPWAALRVLAGPGSGKTRVLTSRVAHLVASGVAPGQILCITFTNKASLEMRERIEAQLGAAVARGITAGTFHSVCLRLLRKHIGDVPGALQTGNFTVYDAEDSEQLMRGVLTDLGLQETKEDKSAFNASTFHSLASRAKNALARAHGTSGGEAFEALVRVGAVSPKLKIVTQFKTAFDAYNAALARANALDYDDLLAFAVAALAARPTLAARLVRRWRHVLVDEFQDTNTAQYELVRLLTQHESAKAGTHSLLVVGDADQSIYGWRGAEVDLMRQRFTRDTGAATAPLAANYRSTPQVCAAADAVLAESPVRSELRVRPVRDDGPPVALWTAQNSDIEADMVADEVKRLLGEGELRGSDIAILYRANWLSRGMERALLRRGVRYVVLGGLPFFSRREIKDLTALLRLVLNPHDEVAFRRMVNTPARQISGATQDKLAKWAEDTSGVSVSAAVLAGAADDDAQPLPPAAEMGLKAPAARAVAAFREMYASWVHVAREESVASLLKTIIRDISYREYLADEADNKGDERWQNVQELMSLAGAAAAEGEAPPVGLEALSAFLEDAALQSATDSSSKETPDAVRLITMHGSKGLEYEAVFAVGLNDGIIPAERALRDALTAEVREAALEEERRIMYVAVTRAKRRLYMCCAEARRNFGAGEPAESDVSPFMDAVVQALGKNKKFTVVQRFGKPGSSVRPELVGIQPYSARVGSAFMRSPPAMDRRAPSPPGESRRGMSTAQTWGDARSAARAAMLSRTRDAEPPAPVPPKLQAAGLRRPAPPPPPLPSRSNALGDERPPAAKAGGLRRPTLPPRSDDAAEATRAAAKARRRKADDDE